MVRKKIDNIKYIENKNDRNNTFQKRKRGLLKKAIEFSNKCGLDMTVTISDPNEKRLIEYRSDKKFNTEAAAKIAKKDGYTHEKYTNEAYYDFVTKKELNELHNEGNLPDEIL